MTARELYERETGKNALRQIGKRLPENTWQFSAWLESRAVLAEELRGVCASLLDHAQDEHQFCNKDVIRRAVELLASFPKPKGTDS